MSDKAIATFTQGFRGTVITRSHPDYDEARKLYNGMIDKRPLIVARCADVADVIAAVNFGRDNKLPIKVFNLNVKGNIMRMAMGEPIGTIIQENARDRI